MLLSFSTEKAKPKISILFIGNSLTYYFDMPITLQKMFDDAKLNYSVSQSTFPGISLESHLNTIITSKQDDFASSRPKQRGDTSDTERALLLKKWDHIILQEGTVRLLIQEVKTLQVIPAINDIKKLTNNDNTSFVLFKTWPSLDTFPKQFCYPSRVVSPTIKKEKCCSPMIKSLDEEVKLINAGYDTVAKVTNIKTVPITNCYLEILKLHQNIILYDDDQHPSKLGAYLNACVFFKYFTKRKATSIKYHAGIDEEKIRIIQSVVDKNYP